MDNTSGKLASMNLIAVVLPIVTVLQQSFVARSRSLAAAPRAAELR